MSDQFKIGDVVYAFDVNRRVYDKTNKFESGPIYREHFSPHHIVGEEKQSWIVSTTPGGRWTIKVGKQKFSEKYYTADQVDDMCWRNEHQHNIVSRVQNCSLADLKRIAAILEYRS